MPSGAGVTWSISPAGVYNIVPSGNSVSVTKVGSGTATLTAAISSGCGNSTLSKTLSTSPSLSISSNSSSSCSGTWTEWYVQASSTSSGGTYSWSAANVPSGTSVRFNNPSAPSTYVSISGKSGAAINCTFTDNCGNKVTSGTTIYSPCSFSTTGATFYGLSPNPASSTVTIQPNNVSSDATGISAMSMGLTNNSTVAPNVTQVNIYNSMGKIVRTQKFNGNSNKVQLNVAGLASGIYYVEIISSNGGEKQTLQIK